MTRIETYLSHHTKMRSEAPALRDADGLAWTWADLDRAAGDVARALSAQGIAAGDRVMIIGENCAAMVAALLGGWRAGTTVLPVNARLTNGEIDRVIDHATPAAVMVTGDVSADAAAHGARLRCEPMALRFDGLSIMRLFDSAPDFVEGGKNDLAAILYTTGTTGTPKGVMLTHANLIFGGQLSMDIRAMSPVDVVYGVLPMSHVFGLTSILVGALISGAQVWLEPRFSAAKTVAALQSGVTLLSAVPQMHAQIMHHAQSHGMAALNRPALRYVSSGAAPLDPEWKRLAEAFYGVALQNGYGMTETSAGVAVTQNRIGDPDISCGPAAPQVEVAIDQSTAGGGDGVGEVMVRGPNVMRGYYLNSTATDQALSVEGWLHTGDIGTLDAQGNLHILGRSKELIIHGGFNVYPPEVEAALNDHPQVIQSAVVGRQTQGDEEVLAFVQAAADNMPTAADLHTHARARLAGYKCPTKIVIATQLPAAPTGKILKHELLSTFSHWL